MQRNSQPADERPRAVLVNESRPEVLVMTDAPGTAGLRIWQRGGLHVLRRSEQDCAYRYLCELDLDKNLRTWLDQLNDYHQAVIKQKLEERADEAE